MYITFRVDASIAMGTGHVMRCLTLANALAAIGAHCHFICREHPGNLIALIKDKGHRVSSLPLNDKWAAQKVIGQAPAHAHWLGSSPSQDAEQTITALGTTRAQWLIVDHYALDAQWQEELQPYYQKLMVIDDLADRPHLADLLLDQTLGRDAQDYNSWVPKSCKLFCGAQYALLAPEFALLRPLSLKNRHQPQLGKILINLGGVDQDNLTTQVLKTLSRTHLPAHCEIIVVMGSTAPWVKEVQAQILPWPTKVLVGVQNMAQIMAASDLAIGAAGSTSWERCCLGLPTIMLILAKNQQEVGQSLAAAGAVKLISCPAAMAEQLPEILATIMADPQELRTMSQAAAQVTKGRGVQEIVKILMADHE